MALASDGFNASARAIHASPRDLLRVRKDVIAYYNINHLGVIKML